jgi:hypothetical protein
VDARGTDDDDQSRLDRELIELLNELRVVLPGVQALFAFLLIVPFNNRFSQVTDLDRLLYLVSLLAAALACALFISVPSFHRLRFRQHDKEQLVEYANRAAIGGLVLLAVAMTASVFLVTHVLFGPWPSALLSGALAVVIVGLWWVLPLRASVD